MIPELPIAMLACARIGAPHTVMFGGFSAEALPGRIEDAQAKLLITADGGWRRGKPVDLKAAADEAVGGIPDHRARARRPAHWATPRRRHDPGPRRLVARHRGSSERRLPAGRRWTREHMLYLLYTSGTTARPKGIIHTSAGYLLGTSYSHEMVFDIKPDDVYWCAADIGWVTGHSYIVYGPLANATTGVMYEGAPDTPGWDRWWQIVEDYKVTVLYMAPTAIRAFMKQGEELPGKHDLSSLRLLGSVGEPINPEAWLWYHAQHRRGALPHRRYLVADRDRPDPDHAAAGRHRDQAGQRHVPFPGRLGGRRGRNGEPCRWARAATSCSSGRGRRCCGASTATRSATGRPTGAGSPACTSRATAPSATTDGYFWLLGRVDDVMNVAGHRI